MAVNEKSVGIFYAAVADSRRRVCPPHFAGIVQMEKPWRRGHAVVLPIWPWSALILGLWWRTIEKDIDEDFIDDQWFDPAWLETKPEEIRDWAKGEVDE